MHEAIKCLQAIRVNSPVTQIRYNHVVELALNDPQANFTPEDRALLAGYLTVSSESTRDYTLRVRLTDVERAQLQEAADQAGQDMSEYVRRKLFG